jgi:hypothetical protein
VHPGHLLTGPKEEEEEAYVTAGPPPAASLPPRGKWPRDQSPRDEITKAEWSCLDAQRLFVLKIAGTCIYTPYVL